MISNFIWLMKLVRTKILEGLILPELDISYWDFCIILAVVGIVATVLINAVKISGNRDAANATKGEDGFKGNFDRFKAKRKEQRVENNRKNMHRGIKD